MAEMPPEMMGKPIGKASKRMEHPREKGGLNGKIIELNGWLFSTSCLIIAGYTKITKAGQTERSSDKMVDINTIRLYIYIYVHETDPNIRRLQGKIDVIG
jgi:hypothetical protein